MENDLETLYVFRSLSYDTSRAIREWATSQGIMSTLEGWDMHVTLVYSKSPLLWSQGKPDREVMTIRGGKRSVELFGDDHVLVLTLESEDLQLRHKELIAIGAVSDYPNYWPHVTITYKGTGVDVSQIVPYDGDIELGCEWWQPVNGNPYGKRDMMTDQVDSFQSFGKAQVVKVNSRLGLVFGYAIVSKVNGEEYYDHHGDHIPEDSMLKASVGFMKSYRISGDMHERDANGSPVQDGDVVFAFPMTQEIADSLNITVEKTGLLVAIQPSSVVLRKFESGEYTGFSIGGRRITDEEVI